MMSSGPSMVSTASRCLGFSPSRMSVGIGVSRANYSTAGSTHSGTAGGAPAPVVLEPVEWSDASLGCPEPDTMDTQVVTPGFRLVFEHQVRSHEYHTDRDGSNVVACEDG